MTKPLDKHTKARQALTTMTTALVVLDRGEDGTWPEPKDMLLTKAEPHIEALSKLITEHQAASLSQRSKR